MNNYPHDQGLKFASIDIGSNAMRLLLCRVIESSNVSFVKESLIRMPLRLGGDAFTSGIISDKNIQKLKKTIHAFYLMIQAYDPLSFKSCATAALRTASNGQKIAEEINKTLDVNLKIISGDEEARIIMTNHIEKHLDLRKNYVYIDVGGGSTEISFISNKQKAFSRSFPIGSVRLLKNQILKSDWDMMEKWILNIRQNIEGPMQAIGSGGNINKIYSIANRKINNEIDVDEIKNVLDTIHPFSIKDRIVKLGLRPDRADVIMHGGKIYKSVMDWASCEKMIVPQSGLPDGIIHDLYEQYQNS